MCDFQLSYLINLKQTIGYIKKYPFKIILKGEKNYKIKLTSKIVQLFHNNKIQTKFTFDYLLHNLK